MIQRGRAILKSAMPKRKVRQNKRRTERPSFFCGDGHFINPFHATSFGSLADPVICEQATILIAKLPGGRRWNELVQSLVLPQTAELLFSIYIRHAPVTFFLGFSQALQAVVHVTAPCVELRQHV